MESSSRHAWRLAWVVFVLSIPLRLYYFTGYGLGDDYYFAGPPIELLDHGTLNLEDYRTNRPVLILLQVLAFSVLSINDLGFVLPILLFSLGTHALSLLLVRDVLNARAALFTSLIFATCPFETLTATSFVPDVMLGFYGIAVTWACYRGWQRRSAAAMAVGGVAMVLALLTKVSAILMLPAVALATVATWRHWRRWLVFWAVLGVGLALAAGAFWLLSGDAVGRFTRRPWGHDVTHMLGDVLMTYPRYVLGPEPQFGGWLFGISGIVALVGLCVAATRVMCGRGTPAAVILTLALCYLVVFNVAPHKLDLTAYFSHPRIFRYLAQVAPFLYVAAAYVCDALWTRGRAGRVAAACLVSIIGACGLWMTPAATAPSWDSSRDGRMLTRFMRDEARSRRIAVSGDEWNCYRLRYMNDGLGRGWRFHCSWLEDDQQKRDFLGAVEHGYVITGGASLAWYSNHPWVLNLDELGFTPPATWRLVLEVDGEPKPWRREPLRVWRLAEQDGDVPIAIADPHLEACLRERVEPLRPQDGLAPDRPITRHLARFVVNIDCHDAGIRDLSGIEHFVGLETLHVGGNALTRADVSALTRLKVLILGANRIEHVEGVPRLRELRTLWLGQNRLERIDVSGLDRLEDLRLDYNALVDISGTEDLVALHQLFLAGNPALDCDALALPAALIESSRCGAAR